MLNDLPSPKSIERRAFLRAGLLGLGGLNLARLAAAREASVDTSVILLYLHGGPSQLETYDLKPDAPIEYRSVFAPISTNIAGMDICEHFPLQAKLADKFSLVRSLNHDVGIHSDGGIIVLTGKRPTVLDPTSQSKSEHPDLGAVVSHMRGFGQNAIPPSVAIPQKPYMTRPTYLGAHHGAFEINNPHANNYRPPQISLAPGTDTKIFEERHRLMKMFDRYRTGLDASGAMNSVDRFHDLAFDMLTSPQAAAAFDLSREEESLRDRYGRHLWGQGCLLARRLAEAGVGVTTLYINTPENGQEFTNWDDHIMNAGRPGHFGDYMKVRLPYLDQALSALIEDVFARDLDRRIMVVVMGEFGRTPRLSHNANGTGRDHWPQAYSALISGGGMRMGQVVGSTNSKAEYPTDRPYSPQDLLATIYRHLRISPDHTFLDFAGRPIAILPSGSPIRELV
ncbi:MAG: DUF1501 domain-containing protein [Planctomycetes bacterium]|nr:DUF1501 domain-containing protein [Planctomycetota bacterium]